jgi:hypothetical protein
LIFSCAQAALDSKMLVNATAPIPLFNITLSSQFKNVPPRRARTRSWTTSPSFATKSPGRLDNISGKECRISEA